MLTYEIDAHKRRRDPTRLIRAIQLKDSRKKKKRKGKEIHAHKRRGGPTRPARAIQFKGHQKKRGGQARALLHICPHTTAYVSSCSYGCVLILLRMCPHTAVSAGTARARTGEFGKCLFFMMSRMSRIESENCCCTSSIVGK